LSGEYRHLAKNILQVYLINSVASSTFVIDADIQFAIEQNKKGVPSPVSFMDDLLAGTVHVKACVRTNTLISISSSINHYLKIQLVFEMTLMFFDQFRQNATLSDSFDYLSMVFDFARHKSPIGCSCELAGQQIWNHREGS
jgi:hypothetical protein